MKNFLKHFLAGVAIVAGIAAGGATIDGLRAASLSLFNGPAQSGGNPINFPPVIADLNALINAVNLALAPGGTGTIPGYLNLTGSPTSTNGTISPSTTDPLGPGMLQLVNPGSWTFTTSTKCSTPSGTGVTGQNLCLIIQDVSGTIRYIPAY
jgi:hypothetical protein